MLDILIVEDESIVALELEFRVIDEGYNVIAVTDIAEKAIEIARTNKPDIALMDITLKGQMNGIECAKILKTLGVPVIYLSANSDSITSSEMEVTAPVGIVQKPFDFTNLFTLLDDFYKSHRAT